MEAPLGVEREAKKANAETRIAVTEELRALLGQANRGHSSPHSGLKRGGRRAVEGRFRIKRRSPTEMA